MRSKIFRNVTAYSIVFIFLAFLAVALVSYNQMESNMQNSVQNETRYMTAALNDLGEQFLRQEVANASTNRLTLIDVDGTVLYDSNKQAAEMENHEDRPEILSAFAYGTGEDTRLSETLGDSTYYYATRLESGQVIRVSATIDSVWAMIISELSLIGFIIVVLMLMNMFVTRNFTERLVEPINNLDLEHPLENEIYEELSPLLGRIHRQNAVISSQIDAMNAKHQEYLAITDNMKDGLIVTNQREVLSMNKAAQKIYQIKDEECIGKSVMMISRQKELKKVWEEAISGKSSKITVEMHNQVYELLANPVCINEEPEGVVILILDITEKAQAEERRREFTANVSHELKTPLMSISGYAELMQHNMVQPKDVPEFAGRIYSEAKRLTEMVEDIIRLSKMDELGTSIGETEAIDLYDISRDIVGCLEMPAQMKHVSFTITGEPVTINGVRQIIYEMLYNLCDNSIKYNCDNGKVYIHMTEKDGRAVWQIKDTGIGIAAEEQERIFERFYRVDKSHSRDEKNTGGTGLGLSIVKHGAILHHAEVQVESSPGEGTLITLVF